MQRQPLTNSTLILVFGILSIVSCCCSGFLGLIFGIVALVLARKAEEEYAARPDIYSGYQNVKTGKTLAIIGIILSVLYLILATIMIAVYGWDGIMEAQDEFMRGMEDGSMEF